MKTVSTSSFFQRSMKLSSCACAAVVSVSVMVRIAVEPELDAGILERRAR